MDDESSHMSSYPRDDSLARGWQDLGTGAPTLIALAKRSSAALAAPPQPCPPTQLSLEAQALLAAARDRGVFEVKGANTAFEAPSRWLAVWAEQPDERWIEFRCDERPELTVRFLDGFFELCGAALVMHHLYRDFSLTKAGFEAARNVNPDDVAPLLQATVTHH